MTQVLWRERFDDLRQRRPGLAQRVCRRLLLDMQRRGLIDLDDIGRWHRSGTERTVGRMRPGCAGAERADQQGKRLRRPTAVSGAHEFGHALVVDSQTTIDGRQFGLTVVRDGMYDIYTEHLQFLRQKFDCSNNAAHGWTPCPSGTVNENENGNRQACTVPDMLRSVR